MRTPRTSSLPYEVSTSRAKDDVWSERVAIDLAAHHGLRREHVRVGAGATQLIDLLLRALCRGPVVDVTPNFHLTATIARREGWEYHAVPVREPDTLLAALAPYLDRDDAVISLSSPRNPLGYQFSLAAIAALLDRARGPVLLDEVYADFAPQTAMRLTEEYENLVVVRTFSKAWGLANLRIGFAVSALFAEQGLVLPMLPNSVAGVAQRAARHLLAHPEPVRESVAAAQEGRAKMVAALEQLPGVHVWPSDANYICVETPLAQEIVAALAGIGYPVRLIDTLKGYPQDWPSGVRITVPPQAAADAVVTCISRLVLRSGVSAPRPGDPPPQGMEPMKADNELTSILRDEYVDAQGKSPRQVVTGTRAQLAKRRICLVRGFPLDAGHYMDFLGNFGEPLANYSSRSDLAKDDPHPQINRVKYKPAQGAAKSVHHVAGGLRPHSARSWAAPRPSYFSMLFVEPGWRDAPEGERGESVVVSWHDLFTKLAERDPEVFPEHFTRLSKTPITFGANNVRETLSDFPLFYALPDSRDPYDVGVRLKQDLADKILAIKDGIPEFGEYQKALDYVMSASDEEQYQACFPMEAGDLLLLDNNRFAHGRRKIVGERVVDGEVRINDRELWSVTVA